MNATMRYPTSDDTSLPKPQRIAAAREVMRLEAIALWKLSQQLGDEFAAAIELLESCHGSVIVTGMGKAGLIGQKIAATLASTGQPSHFLHPAEAFHGDLGRVGRGDIVLMLSQSGETAEVTQLLPSLREFGAPILAITASTQSTVGRAARVVLPLGQLDEACSLGLAPSTSTTAMLAVGDAIALVLSSIRGFRAEDFARFHPGGSLGRKLALVEDEMRPLTECRVAKATQTVREVLVGTGKPGRRTGAVMLIADDGSLEGLFTDSDLARLLEKRDLESLDRPVSEFMVRRPTTIQSGARMSEAVALLADRKFSELPVIDAAGKAIGLVDVTDVVAREAGDAPTVVPKAPPKPAVRIFPGEDVYAAG
ncbi:Arabinose 5-phosphate isomerase KpsF [Botrimarina colliarenosi]|uniref:Arabinose 5-phosphate isomerase KpsF n=1 Tax=Botrimarina colliarenosi TaxID=2528001 RepID=A0A5C6AJI2_9BACT|nr:KpsF/GutQ family sugar-phosphate isomerase [Botrimarina colliarenosi]TWT99809.1 Arabinose 5-phosphate isomerase KpsF [Botrimarina colliarenosi]